MAWGMYEGHKARSTADDFIWPPITWPGRRTSALFPGYYKQQKKLEKVVEDAPKLEEISSGESDAAPSNLADEDDQGPN